MGETTSGADGIPYKDIIDNLYDGVYCVDRQRIIRYWNKGAERVTGYTKDQVIGRSCSDELLNHVNANGEPLCGEKCPLKACIETGASMEADVFLHHADGHRVPVLVRGAPVMDAGGAIVGAVETFTPDIAVRSVRRELRELRHTAHVDALTAVGNRQFLEGRLHAAVAEMEFQQETTDALLFIDVDHFKAINDGFGHDAGDRVLRMIAATLKENLRRTDVVGRWGGEEFLAVLQGVRSPEALASVAEKARALVEASRLDLADGALAVTISVGATSFRVGDTPESAVRRADALMYASKKGGRNRVTVG